MSDEKSEVSSPLPSNPQPDNNQVAPPIPTPLMQAEKVADLVTDMQDAPVNNNEEKDQNIQQEEQSPTLTSGKKSSEGRERNPTGKMAEEMMDDFKNFVADINAQITEKIKEVGANAWNSLKNTEPMQKLNGALDEAKNFLGDKIDEKLDGIKNSEQLSQIKDFASSIKSTINDSFAKVANMAAEAVVSAVKTMTSSPMPELSQPNNSPSTDTKMAAEKYMEGVEDVQKASPQLPSSIPAPNTTLTDDQELQGGKTLK